MNHRKVHSQGHIPFSWEEKPGIPKSNHQKSSSDIGLTDLKSESDMNARLMRVAPPPPCAIQPPRRSYSSSSRRWEDDPFLAALKFCKKSVANLRGYEESRQKKGKNLSKGSVFSCKHSCNVENDNLVKFSKLPPIPKERYNAKRYNAKSFVRN